MHDHFNLQHAQQRAWELRQEAHRDQQARQASAAPRAVLQRLKPAFLARLRLA